MKLSDLAQKIDGILEMEGDVDIQGVAAIGEAVPGEISFIANPKYASLAAETKASAVIVSKDWASSCSAPVVRVESPDAAFAKVAMLFYAPVPVQSDGIHPSAVVADDVELGAGVRVGPLCVVESGVKLGAGTTISAQCYIGHRSQIGENTFFHPQVSIREDAKIGDRVIIHSGTVIGSDGFGYSVDKEGVRTKIPQIGIVEIGDDVEIGSNVSVDRARFGKTRIGSGVKIDNLVQIAHNVQIGDHSVIIAQVGIAGSTTIGKKVIFAGASGAAGHISIGDGAIIGARSAVLRNVAPGEFVIGYPAMPAAKFKRVQASLVVLPKIRKRLRELEKTVRELTGKSE